MKRDIQRMVVRLALIAATVTFALTGHHGFAIGFAIVTVLSLFE